MPFFHFHLHEGNVRHDDEIGLELPGIEAAYLQAVAAARGMAGDLIAEGTNPALCTFEIATADGVMLLSVAFSELFARDTSIASRPSHETECLKRALESNHRRALTAKAEFAGMLSRTRASLAESHALLSRLTSFERRCWRTDTC